MAVQVNVKGLATIKVGTGAAGALETLGYTDNGVQQRYEGFYENVPGDEKGGDSGPPVEIIYLGEVCHIRMELTKYDPLIAAKIEARCKGAVAGVPQAAGSLMFAGGYYYRVLINSTTDPRNYPYCVLRSAMEVNAGSKYSRFVCEFEAHNVGGTLWNATTTG